MFNSLLLYVKLRRNRSFGSCKEGLYSVLPYMGLAAILVMWPVSC